MKYEDLRRLQELKQKGIINEAEFEKRKEKLMEHNPNHVYHAEPNHREEMEKHHEAAKANHHIVLNHSYEPLTFHHHFYQEKKPHYIGTKSKKLAGFLGIFLGGLGIHNFYLSHHGKAMFQLLVTILCIIFTGYGGKFFMYVPFVWGAVEGVMILIGAIHTDAHNIELK